MVACQIPGHIVGHECNQSSGLRPYTYELHDTPRHTLRDNYKGGFSYKVAFRDLIFLPQ